MPEEAIDGTGEQSAKQTFQAQFDGRGRREQVQLKRYPQDLKRQQAFLRRIEPAKRMFDQKLKFAEKARQSPEKSPRSPRKAGLEQGEPSMKVSPSVFNLINTPPSPERVSLMPILQTYLDQHPTEKPRTKRGKTKWEKDDQTGMSKSKPSHTSQGQTEDDDQSIQCVNLNFATECLSPADPVKDLKSAASEIAS